MHYCISQGVGIQLPLSFVTIQTRKSVARAPLVSIGLPVFNGAAWLERTLESLRTQSVDDLELIISDNASVDSTASLCRRYASIDSRIKVIRNATNIGANRNYLAVLDAARGRYFKWAACGDHCAPNFLECCLEILEARPDVAVAAPRSFLMTNGLESATPYSDDFDLLQEDPAERFIAMCERMRLNNAMNGVIRRSALQQALPMGTFWGSDILLMAELALLGKFALTAERVFYRRMAIDTATILRSDAEIQAHIDPVHPSARTWQQWEYSARLLHIVARSAPWFGPKFSALRHSVRMLLWSRHDLAREMRTGLRRFVSH